MSLAELTPELVEKARNELGEDPETRMALIEELRERLKDRPDLRFEKADKDMIKFLRARKFDVDRAYELIINHYEKKREMLEMFSNFSPSAERGAFESGFNIVFPEKDQHGQTVFAFRPGIWDPKERSLLNNLRANLIAIDLLLEDEVNQINGIVIIADFRDFGLAQAAAMSLWVFHSYGSLLLNFYPVRIKSIHVLDQPKIFSVVFAIISKFMKEKLRKRVYLHGGNIVGLHNHIDCHLVPSDFGGEGEPTNLRSWVKRVMESEEESPHLWQ